MRFIKRAIYNLMNWARSGHEVTLSAERDYPVKQSTIGSNRHGPDMVGMNFTVFNAVGGKVIQINQYNPINDRHKQQLYIVTDKEDLGVELGQIITVEGLSR